MSTEEKPNVLVSEEGPILIFTLNRPEKRNAINNVMSHQLGDVIDRFRDDETYKVLLIRSVGDYFSAGADLKEGSPARKESATAIRGVQRRMPARMRQIWDEIEAVEKPVVVAHQGPVLAAGLELSMSCDFRLASTKARYGLPEGKFGMLPANNGVSRLTRIVGPAWARLLVMANLEADAEEARIMGLVHKVYPAETFEEDVMNFCRNLAAQHAEQMAAAKVAIELAADVGANAAGAVERLAQSALMLSPGFREAKHNQLNSFGSTPYVDENRKPAGIE